ncbi:unnamed protein product, partial [Ectocarpus fasciculatus]
HPRPAGAAREHAGGVSDGGGDRLPHDEHQHAEGPLPARSLDPRRLRARQPGPEPARPQVRERLQPRRRPQRSPAGVIPIPLAAG